MLTEQEALMQYSSIIISVLNSLESVKFGLSKDAVDYHRRYIQEKLCVVQSATEFLADQSLQLTRVALAIQAGISQNPSDSPNGVAWRSLKSSLTEVRDALTERDKLVRRTDSDLRLHERLIDRTPSDVVGNSAAWRGSASKEIDL